jgi:hypothetical protein
MIDVTIHNTGTWWSTANLLTLVASLITLLSVILAHRHNKRQLDTMNTMALKQINAAAAETSKKLRAEVLLKENQVWISEFRETINQILYLGDPDLDGLKEITLDKRISEITRLGHKTDLLLPVGKVHKDLILSIISFATMLKESSTEEPMDTERLGKAGEIVILTRRIISEEKSQIESRL